MMRRNWRRVEWRRGRAKGDEERWGKRRKGEEGDVYTHNSWSLVQVPK
jgi:hypothetical protein